MSDEKPVPETLESIGQQIRELAKSFTERFDGIDTRFDELKARLRTEIEAVRGDIRIVAEGMAAQYAVNQQNDADHEEFRTDLDRHDAPIAVLEPKKPA